MNSPLSSDWNSCSENFLEFSSKLSMSEEEKRFKNELIALISKDQK